MIGFPGSIGASITLGPQGLSTTIGLGLPTGGQTFTNIPQPNNRLALYMLSIRDPSPARLSVMSYIFPISPSQLTKDYAALSQPYSTAGTPQQRGVRRSIDTYGSEPPTYVISGTTGWQRHSTDGYGLTGLQSIARIQALLAAFDQLNQTQVQNGIATLYTLELYDYFAGEFWQVVPVGRQVIDQDAARPLIFRYTFRLMAIQSVLDPPPIGIDPILNLFASSATQAQLSLSASIGVMLSAYAPLGAIG